MMDKLTVRKIEHRGEARIAFDFARSPLIESMVRQIPGRCWSATLKCWHIPYGVETWKTLQLICKDKIEIIIEGAATGPKCKLGNTIAKKGFPAIPVKERADDHYLGTLKCKPGVLHPSNEKIMENYKAMLEIKKYSPATLNAYIPFFRQYIMHFEGEGKPIDSIHYSDMYEYISCKTNKLGYTQTKQLVCSIKFYYERILGHEKLYFSLGSDHYIKPLPTLFDYEEIQKVVGPTIRNYTHRLCLWLVFHFGLKAGDLICLPKEMKQCFQKFPCFSENEKTTDQLLTIAKNHLEQTKNVEFLFEKKGRPFSVGEMRQFIWWLVSNYKLEAIFRKQFRNMIMQTNLEKTTCEQYEGHFITFLKTLNYINPATIGPGQIKEFLHAYGNGRAADTQNAMITALRFYYKHCLKRNFLPSELPRARRPQIKPQVLSLEEIAAIIGAIDNEKQRNLISIIYSAGLRRSEVRNLKLSDIDYSRGLLYIKSAKGKKDRFTLLSQSLSFGLKSYIEKYKPQHYVFEGEKPGMPYSYASMDKTLKRAVAKAGILKRVNLHLLRHSFATHVLEDGYDTRYLQQLLGHNSIKTTQAYTHLTNESVLKVRSPFDKLKLGKGKDKTAL
jgi:site-specific recombinase XerD